MHIIPDHHNVRPLGRTHALPGALWLCFSGSGAEFTACGTWVQVTLAADDRGIQVNEPVRFAIEVDGVRAVDDRLNQPEKVCRVPLGLHPALHTVRIIKLSESAMSTCGVRAIEADGEICPTSPKARRIEFIGDSITCGYGVDDGDPLHHFSTCTEDVTRTYAWRTARALNADRSMVSLSGYGVISGYTATAEEPIPLLIPACYDKLGLCYGRYDGGAPQDIPWDFSAFRPDVIVINLGTNDNSYTLDIPDRQAHYQREYTAFLGNVRRRNPDAYILCTLGIMGDSLYPRVEAAVAEHIHQTGDQHISCMPFVPQREEDGYAADYHPTPATHQKAALHLTQHLKKLMNW